MYPDKQEKLTRRKQIKCLPRVTSLLHGKQVGDYAPPFFAIIAAKMARLPSTTHPLRLETWTTHSNATLRLGLLIPSPPLQGRFPQSLLG